LVTGFSKVCPFTRASRFISVWRTENSFVNPIPHLIQ
jgi:hypothetical protein